MILGGDRGRKENKAIVQDEENTGLKLHRMKRIKLTANDFDSDFDVDSSLMITQPGFPPIVSPTPHL